MASSEQIFQEIRAMGNKPRFDKQVKQAYADPVIKPLIKEGAKLEGQYLPTVFNAFQGGTGAADLTAGDKLQMMGNSLGRLESRLSNNRGIQNFFQGQIGDVISGLNDAYNSRMGNLMRQYQMRSANERAGAAAQRGIDYSKFMQDQAAQRNRILAGQLNPQDSLAINVGNRSETGSAVGDALSAAGRAGIGVGANAFKTFDSNIANRLGFSVARNPNSDAQIAANMNVPLLRQGQDFGLRVGDLFNTALGQQYMPGYMNYGDNRFTR